MKLPSLITSLALLTAGLTFADEERVTKTTTVTPVQPTESTTTTTKTTTTTTTSNGTITEYNPGSTFIVKEESGPVTYHYGKKVEYVTRKGKILSEDEVRTRVKVGIPVSVHYAHHDKDRVISRVVIDD